tara:strand:+ start:143 stop:328 length:186 start_codon:yes stop_codon:yes gene_type:complete
MNFKKIGKIIAATAVASCGVLSAAVAADCKNPEVIRFTMTPTEETTTQPWWLNRTNGSVYC